MQQSPLGRLRSICSLGIAIPLVSPFVAGQLSIEISPDIGRIPIHTSNPDPLFGPYGTWAAGNGYKVSFDGGMRFIPMLGPDYPELQSWSWHTTSVRAGETELLRPGERPLTRRSDYRFEYRYTAVVEAYDVLDDGVEQTFVLDTRPPCAGDLVITGQIDTGLEAPAHPADHQRLVFADGQGLGIVSYGRATTIDAAGRHHAIDTEYTDGQVRLVVPANVLEDAHYPLVVDPLIRRADISMPTLDGKVAVGYDRPNQQLLIAFSLWSFAGDSDLHAQVYPEDFSGPPANVFNDIEVGWSSREPAIASSLNPRMQTIAYTRGVPQGVGGQTNTSTRYHVRNGGTIFGSTVYTIPTPAGWDDRRPDVGGTLRTTNGTAAMIVMERTTSSASSPTARSEIIAVPIDLSGPTPIQKPAVRIQPTTSSPSANPVLSRPSINKVGGSPQSNDWVVAFCEIDATSSQPVWRVAARQISADGKQSAAAWTSSAGGVVHAMAPKIAGDRRSTHYGIAFVQSPVLSGFTPYPNTGHDVLFERIDWPSGGSAKRMSTATLHLGSFPSTRVGDCSFDSFSRSHWAISLQDPEVFLRVGYRGGVLERFPITVPGGDPHTGGIDALDDGGYVALYNGRTSITAITHGVNAPPRASATGPSCSPASIEWTTQWRQQLLPQHAQQIGHGYTEVRVAGAPIGALHYLLVSLTSVQVPLVGPGVAPGCWQLVPFQFLWSGPRSGPEAVWPFPLPEFLPPITLQFQDVHLDITTGLAQTTSRLTVDVTR